MPQDPLSHHFATQAYQSAWANHRLLSACGRLGQTEFVAVRTSFFPSIRATLNHIQAVDQFYLDALERDARAERPHTNPARFFDEEMTFDTCTPLHAAQTQVDKRLIAYCLGLEDVYLSRQVAIARPDRVQIETRTRLLAHLFEHQTHHRGQVHAMLSGTTVKPPQLDEFFCAMDEALRAADLAAMGLREADLWPSRAV
ncbi:MAG: DinB protein [Rhodoferax sp.]|nr:DinB protein [Rhodoferax sp.]